MKANKKNRERIENNYKYAWRALSTVMYFLVFKGKEWIINARKQFQSPREIWFYVKLKIRSWFRNLESQRKTKANRKERSKSTKYRRLRAKYYHFPLGNWNYLYFQFTFHLLSPGFRCNQEKEQRLYRIYKEENW